MPSIGGWEWLIILVIVIIIFGVGKLGDVGGALGKSMKEFRSAATEEGDADAETDADASKSDTDDADSKVTESNA